MNRTTHAIFTLLHYSILLRDTLEYTLVKEGKEYNVEMFKERRRVLLESLDKPTQLADFLKRNGETGAKIDSQLREFIEEIYGDDSIVLRLSNEGLRVDHSQHIKIYSYVVGLYETLSDIVYGFINHGQKENLVDEEFLKAVEVNNKFYRGISYMVIFTDLVKTFKEFNDAMRENNGQPSPQSNFITNDINQLVSFLNFIRAHSQFDRNQPKADAELITMFDATENIISKMNGRVKLAEGENLFASANETLKQIQALVAKYEQLNMVSLQKLFADANKFLAEQAKAAGNEVAKDENTEVPGSADVPEGVETSATEEELEDKLMDKFEKSIKVD
ncbi:MAG: hypothetical protein ACI311_03390 [Bacilli bacterium]